MALGGRNSKKAGGVFEKQEGAGFVWSGVRPGQGGPDPHGSLKLSREHSAHLQSFWSVGGHGACSKVTTVRAAGQHTWVRKGSCQHQAAHGNRIFRSEGKQRGSSKAMTTLWGFRATSGGAVGTIEAFCHLSIPALPSRSSHHPAPVPHSTQFSWNF